MIQVIQIIFLYSLLFNTETFGAEENSICTTPRGESGGCIAIRKCEPLLELLQTGSKNPDNVQYLKRSLCGRSANNQPLVCCSGVRLNGDIKTAPAEPDAPSNLPNSGTYSLPSAPACGVNGKFEDRRVVGGWPASKGQFPWIGALGYSKDKTNPRWLCGGTLITKRHMLTAGHCVHGRPDLYIVRLGALDIYNDPNPVDVTVEEARLHEGYNPTEITNDIAILKLSRDVETTAEPPVKPICLPVQSELRNNLFVKYNPFVAGWGSIYFNGPATATLQALQLPVVTNEWCANSFAKFKTAVIDNRVICAGFSRGGKDTCQGDSGGPLMLAEQFDGDNFAYYQIGVISYGFRCAEPGYVGVYTRVTQFLDWIQTKLY